MNPQTEKRCRTLVPYNSHEQSGRSRDLAEHLGQKHHLLIAGTGRAGTSALVRYLTALGLETHLSKHGDAGVWFDAAQAGLEDLPVSTIAPDLPYVVKSPWSYQFIEQVTADPRIRLDAVIVPVRHLTEAAASRTILEIQALYGEAGWMAQMSTTWEEWGSTPGGTIFSLNPIDQARLLAVGFHRLLERLVQVDVPIVLLAFPRLTSDPDYLFGKLCPVLPIEVPIERAREAHAATFSAAMVRVERELSVEPQLWPVSGEFEGPSLPVLDNAALRRSLTQLRNQLTEAEASRTTLEHECGMLRGQLEQQRTQATGDAKRERDEKDQLQRELFSLRTSRSWRITWPLRVLSRAARIIIPATFFWTRPSGYGRANGAGLT